ncbi:hypothetical protein B0O99DRAFT_637350 [Bisporella sp. PMI_857]|nr:hypothetical protein B0O99DRAFT_637350 [Bisporella sp. PMI_857]
MDLGNVAAPSERGREELFNTIFKPRAKGPKGIRRSDQELVHKSYFWRRSNYGGKSSSSLLRQPKYMNIYQDAFIEKFLYNFAPELPGRMMSGQPHNFSVWLLSVVQTRASSPILDITCRCIATSYVAKATSESRLLLESQKMYAKALAMLQTALYSEDGGSVETLGTVLSLTLYEFINYTNPTSWLDHIRGAERLFEFRGSHETTSGIAHDMFLFFRPHGIISALCRSTPNFLSRPEWKTVPWSLDSSSKSLLDHLLDHVADIPTLYSEFEDIEEGLRVRRMSPTVANSRHAALLRSVADMEYRLRNWKELRADSYMNGQPVEVPPCVPDGLPHQWWAKLGEDFQLPPFTCRKGPGRVVASNIYYPDIHLAQALNLYYAALIQLARIDMRPDRISALEVYDLACRISRSAAYFLSAPGCSGALASMFALRVAHYSFQEQSTEREWLERLFERMANNASLDISRHARPDRPPEEVEGGTMLDKRRAD